MQNSTKHLLFVKTPFDPSDNTTNDTNPKTYVRLGVSKKPVERGKDATNTIEHQTVDLEQLCDYIQNGHALGAITRGRHVAENWIARQDVQIDVDAELGSNPIPYLLGIPFVAQYAYLIYTTRTVGHCRIVFRLPKQITTESTYKRWAKAICNIIPGADKNATSATQLWYTEPSCDIAIIGNALPFDEVEKLALRFDDLRYVDDLPAPTNNPETLVQMAWDAIDEKGGRNVAGYWLALQLAKIGLDENTALQWMCHYQSVVEWRGTHAYTAKEAADTLRSAMGNHFTATHRRLDAMLERVAAGTVTITKDGKEKPLPVNVRRTLFAILTAMKACNRTICAELSLRQIAAAANGRIGVESIRRHIDVLDSAGIIRHNKATKHNRASYSLLNVGNSRDIETHLTGVKGEGNTLTNPFPVRCVSISRLFAELGQSAATESNAKLHGAFITDELDYARLGTSAHAILVALAGNGGTVASIAELQGLAALSWRCVKETVKSLAALDIVSIEKQGRNKTIVLSSVWRERLADIEPLLTTYGRDVLRNEKYTKQKISYHDHMAQGAFKPEMKAKHLAMADKAARELESIDTLKQSAAMARKEAAQNIGVTGDLPAISLLGEPKQEITLQPVVDVVERKLYSIAPNGEIIERVIGHRFITRDLIPDKAKVKASPNRMTNAEKAEKQVERIHLGHITDEMFGQREYIAA